MGPIKQSFLLTYGGSKPAYPHSNFSRDSLNTGEMLLASVIECLYTRVQKIVASIPVCGS